MMWLGDKITYTPEIITVTNGEPVEAEVISLSAVSSDVMLRFPDGSEKRVERRLCGKP